MVMARTQTLVQLSDELIEALDRRALADSVSRSHLIRSAVAAFLTDELRDSVGRQIVEGYQRVPQGSIDEWGDLDAMTASASDTTFRRLDAEERAEGHETW